MIEESDTDSYSLTESDADWVYGVLLFANELTVQEPKFICSSRGKFVHAILGFLERWKKRPFCGVILFRAPEKEYNSVARRDSINVRTLRANQWTRLRVKARSGVILFRDASEYSYNSSELIKDLSNANSEFKKIRALELDYYSLINSSRREIKSRARQAGVRHRARTKKRVIKSIMKKMYKI